jgi:Golgi phosphoprotein 3
MSRVVALLTARTTSIPPAALHSSKTDAAIEFPITRAVSLVCAAYAASVLDNALVRLGYDEREAAFNRSDELLNEFCIWPLGSGSSGGSTRRGVGTGGSGPTSKELILALVQAVKAEMTEGKEGDDLCFEVIVTVFEVFSRMDSLLG